MAGQEVSDPTDWIGTQLAPLKDVESLLRCNICKDFFNSAVITTCSHTFCSLCIRRCLDSDGACPTCRSSEQQPRLRRNVAVQELTDSFRESRAHILSIARQPQIDAASIAPSRKRRKLDIGDNSIPTNARSERVTRRSSRRTVTQEELPPTAPSQSQHYDDVLSYMIVDDSEDDEDGTYLGDAGATLLPEPDDGLVPCPMCGKRMKEEQVYPHLDRCEDEQKQDRLKKSKPRILTKPPPEKLPQLNYNLLKDNALRVKLKELGIPSHGTKPQMQRRHMEWVNIWNANSDSARPRSKRELLQDLDTWERVQHGRAVALKDFDGDAWARKNRDDFTDLISQARASVKKATRPPGVVDEHDSTASGTDASRTFTTCQEEENMEGRAPEDPTRQETSQYAPDTSKQEAQWLESQPSRAHSEGLLASIETGQEHGSLSEKLLVPRNEVVESPLGTLPETAVAEAGSATR